MPNWCNNTFEVTGPTETIDEFEKFLDQNQGKDWFNFFAPCPQELLDAGDVSFNASDEDTKVFVEKYGYSDWYSWSVDNWGCKWNCDAQDWNRDGDTIKFWFDSPWGPPTTLYDKIQEQGLSVTAEYNEEGMGFVGEYVDGDEQQYEYSTVEDLDDIPEHLVENWNLHDRFDSWEDDDWNDVENENGKTNS